MELDLAVTLPDSTVRDLTVDLDTLGEQELLRAVDILGDPAPFVALGRGEWNPAAAGAMLQAAVERELGGPIDEWSLDWGNLAGEMLEPDPTFEGSIPMERSP